MNIRNAALLAVLSLGLAVSACQKKEESAGEKVTDAIGDATNSRDNEKLKDAGEDAKDAVDNAAEGVKDTVQGNN
jgi:hypothetical protein